MSIDPTNSDPSDPNPGIEIDCTTYTEILRNLIDTMRTTDFSNEIGGLSFIMGVVNDIYDPATNERSLDRSSDMVTGLSLLLLMTLAESGEPNGVALRVADLLEETTDEMGPTISMPAFDREVFEQMVEVSECVTLTMEELIERSDLPLEEIVTLSTDLARLDNVDDVESLFRQIDGEQ